MSGEFDYMNAQGWEQQPVMEGMSSHDAGSEDMDVDIPYMPQMGGGARSRYANPTAPQGARPLTEGFLDLDALANQNAAQPGQQAPRQQQQQGFPPPQQFEKPRPTWDSASKNLETLTKGLELAGVLADDTLEDGSDAQIHAMKIVISTINDAIRVLGEQEIWLPNHHKDKAEALKKVAKPITNALAAYSEALRKMI
jgi:hypothetical protein